MMPLQFPIFVSLSDTRVNNSFVFENNGASNGRLLLESLWPKAKICKRLRSPEIDIDSASLAYVA
jgi:hypothetical protein